MLEYDILTAGGMDHSEVYLDQVNSMAAEGWRVVAVDWSDRYRGRMLAVLMAREIAKVENSVVAVREKEWDAVMQPLTRPRR